jgi:CRP-like cAMP-binding protein
MRYISGGRPAHRELAARGERQDCMTISGTVFQFPLPSTLHAHAQQFEAAERQRRIDMLLRWTGDVGHSFRMTAGTLAVRQGEPPRRVMLIASDLGLLQRVEANGRETCLALCRPGDLAGLSALVLGAPQAASVLMKTEGDVTLIPSDRVLSALAGADLRSLLLGALASDHHRLLERSSAESLYSARDRVLMLLREATRHATGYPWPIPLSVHELASLTRIDESHGRRLLRELRRDGVIEFSRGRLIAGKPL